ncbi:type I polyketide synthase [Streptomyces peucetius]|uniref:SDR family oxidoreductase n=1 Tax=Streptomyces peucetius TaxID=1950 RepID=A0ABY6I4J0_STRPE|nr:type I polyketide synthase [Streptomyces peucetius]UYQ60922.1 SDR family oxidoreductase [Streptomyces peucetius]
MTEQLPDEPGPFEDGLDIAIVGMAGRFPKARTIEEFWSNLKAGHCAATRFDEQHLAELGADAEALADPDFVPVGYLLEDSDKFDAAFFGYSPREAELMDPQHRVLLECAWSALESAGYDPDRYEGLTGVYAGTGNNTYLLFNIASHPDAVEVMGGNQLVIGNRSDFLSSRVSYKLDLRGPSINVQSACSTSLVAVVQACQALLAYQCDTALAGGVAVDVMRRDGYVYREDGIYSPDGYCRTFDARAQGTVGGDGVGMVVLKRLQDAVDDNDHIHAVIRGSAVNNDGAARAGFSAPSAASQADVIATALANADVDPESIRYVEAHGTATLLGDPIEVSALNSAYGGVPRARTALGSVKTNIGHLDSAAGVAGLIKTALVVERGEIPPTLHFERPNPRLGLESGPFYVNSELLPWPQDSGPRRAAVSSFGLGGTNAHLIVEQPPEIPRNSRSGPDTEQLLVLSAKSPEALDTATGELLDHLRAHPGVPLEDVAFTLQQGRREFPYRRALLCGSVDDARDILGAPDDGRLLTASGPQSSSRPVAFVFTGFGAQYPGMGAGLYDQEEVFREALDECAELLLPLLGLDIRPVMLTADTDSASSGRGGAGGMDLRSMLLQPQRSEHPLDSPRLGYAAVFALEYSLARLWGSWGIEPEAMIGHSLGEYVAACLAGVFSLPDALRLVVERARLIEGQGEGAMLAVPLSEAEADRWTSEDVCLAAVNGPQTCVLSGTVEGIEAAGRALLAEGIASRRLTTGFAFHSPMMDPVVAPYTELVRTVRLNPPATPFVSNMSGTWITPEEATSPEYWAEHMRRPVRFADGIGTLWTVPELVVVEVGPGQSMVPGIVQHPAAAAVADRVVVHSLPGVFDRQSDRATMLRAAARLWLAGRAQPFPPVRGARRTPLPTYPFERRRYWVERGTAAPRVPAEARRHTDPAQWFYAPSWQQTAPVPPVDAAGPAAHSWLVFADETGVGGELADRLEGLGATVRTVRAGSEWSRKAEGVYVLDPGSPEHYTRLAEALREEGSPPDRVLHCWSVGNDADHGTDPQDVRALLDRGFHSLLHWAQATESGLSVPQRWDVVSSEVCSVTGEEALCPPKAAVQGIVRVLPQEYPSLTCVHLDLAGGQTAPAAVDAILPALSRPAGERTLALRGRRWWAPTFVAAEQPRRDSAPVRADGVYLITGGLGKIGMLMARALAERERVRLVLLGRTELPSRETWDAPDHPEATRDLIRGVRALEELGSEVMVCAADVSDPVRMREVKEAVVQAYGRVDGLLHCAGTTGAEAHRVVADLGERESAWHFDPKLYGTYVLDEVLADQELDFALLCSSIASLLGGLGFAAYAAANAVLDAFAQRHHGAGQPWSSVNWEAWRFTAAPRDEAGIGSAVQALALDPDEGRRVTDALLAAVPQAQVVVSTSDPVRRREQWVAPAAEAAMPRQQHERPNLRNPYVAPDSDTERQVAVIWQELLGVQSVGVHDNFFELGGSSLLGLQVVHRLRQELSLPVPLTVVYEGPTVRALGRLVDDLRAADGR